MTEKKIDRGWGKSPASRKWHYFPEANSFSLCGRIGFYYGPREDSDHENPDNCAACKRKRKKES